MRRETVVLFATTMLISALGLSGCGEKHEPGGKAQSGRAVQATVAVAAAARVPIEQATPATLVAVERATVASRLMGHLRDIAVVEGEMVKAGQRLFTVDPVDVSGQAEQARLSVQLAEQAYQDARADFERFGNLYKEEAVSRQQYEKMKLQHDSAAARLAQARAGLGTAQGQMRYAMVTAPIGGVVVQKLANAGDLASPGQPILVIENPGRLQVETQVPENVLRQIRIGQPVSVEVEGRTQRIGARVARISPAADPASRTFLVKLDISGAAQQDGLHSGTFARALFPGGEREALEVPRSAVISRAGIEGLFVVDARGIAEFRMLRTGASRDGSIEVQSGLQPGERYVTDGAASLESGDRVTPPTPR